MRTLLKKALLIAGTVAGCTSSSPKEDPLAVDTAAVNNWEAFRVAATYIRGHRQRFSSEPQGTWAEVGEYLRTKGLALEPFEQFYLSSGPDSGIRFESEKYVSAGDTVFRHSVLYTPKPLRQVEPSRTNRGLIRKLDSNLYYIVQIEQCGGC